MLGPKELDRATCLGHLSEGLVARVGVSTPNGPQVIPVNYVLHDGTLALATTPYSVLGEHARDHLVAVEVDHIDAATRSGWSVVVRGVATAITDTAEIAALRASGLEPWAGGNRPLHLRLALDDAEISGRAVGG